MQERQSQHPARDVLSPTDYVKSFIYTFDQWCVRVENHMAGVGWNSSKPKYKLSLPRLTDQQRLQMWDDMVKQANPTGRQHDTAQPVADPAPTKLLITPEPGVTGRYNHHVLRDTIRPVDAWIQRPYTTEDKLAVSLALQQQRIGLHVAAEQEKMKQAAGKGNQFSYRNEFNLRVFKNARQPVPPTYQ